jgi:MFS family permease
MIVALDGTVLIVAQPSLGRDLGASVAQVQWTSTGYLLAVAALLVIAGRLGDRYGHTRLLLAGVLGFGATSAGIALAPGVMVTTTGAVVGDAPPGYAGVVGGLKQTAMNIGPAFGITIAATMMPLAPSAGVASGKGSTLAVLAALTALGLLPASLLPSRPSSDSPPPAATVSPPSPANPEPR